MKPMKPKFKSLFACMELITMISLVISNVALATEHPHNNRRNSLPPGEEHPPRQVAGPNGARLQRTANGARRLVGPNALQRTNAMERTETLLPESGGQPGHQAGQPGPNGAQLQHSHAIGSAGNSDGSTTSSTRSLPDDHFVQSTHPLRQDGSAAYHSDSAPQSPQHH